MQIAIDGVEPVDGMYTAYGYTQCTRLAFSEGGPKKAAQNADTLMLLAIGILAFSFRHQKSVV